MTTGIIVSLSIVVALWVLDTAWAHCRSQRRLARREQEVRSIDRRGKANVR